jgi:hypothetical protein
LDWLTLITVWGLIAGAIVLAGGMGLLLVWGRKNERSQLARFLLLLIIGLTIVLSLIVIWPLAIVSGVGVFVWFGLKWWKAEGDFRKRVAGLGYKWCDVEIYDRPHCLGFSQEKAEFFAIMDDESVRVNKRDVLGFYIDNDHSDSLDKNHERELIESSSNNFQLVIQTSGGEVKIPVIDELEVADVLNWVENCLNTICLGEFRCFAQNWRSVLGVLQFSDELGFHQYQQGMRYLAIQEISKILLERNWSVEFEDLRNVEHPVRMYPENYSNAQAYSILTATTIVYDTDGEIFAQIEEKYVDPIPEVIQEILRINPAISLEEIDRYVD